MLSVGDPAPDFTLSDADGNPVLGADGKPIEARGVIHDAASQATVTLRGVLHGARTYASARLLYA